MNMGFDENQFKSDAYDTAMMFLLDKDSEFGKFDKDTTASQIFSKMMAIPSSVSPGLTEKDAKDIVQHITDAIPAEVLEKTNVEMHIVGDPAAMSQYISPFFKDYAVGTTINRIEEKVIWSLRPGCLKIGYAKEIYKTNNESRTLEDVREHEFGTAEDCFNMVLLHTTQHIEQKGRKPKEHSTIHLAIQIHIGEVFRKEVAEAYRLEGENIERLKWAEAVRKDKRANKHKNRKRKGRGKIAPQETSNPKDC